MPNGCCVRRARLNSHLASRLAPRFVSTSGVAGKRQVKRRERCRDQSAKQLPARRGTQLVWQPRIDLGAQIHLVLAEPLLEVRSIERRAGIAERLNAAEHFEELRLCFRRDLRQAIAVVALE